MNSNSPGLLRSWPVIDNWQVMLVRAIDNRIVCVTLTGRKSTSDQYLFGIEEDTKNLYVILADQNPEALSGNSVKVIIDNTLIGSYAIDKRRSQGPMSTIRATVPSFDADKLLDLLKVGSSVQFETDEATYSGSLDGMTGAQSYVQNCLVEAQAMAASN